MLCVMYVWYGPDRAWAPAGPRVPRILNVLNFINAGSLLPTVGLATDRREQHWVVRILLYGLGQLLTGVAI